MLRGLLKKKEMIKHFWERRKKAGKRVKKEGIEKRRIKNRVNKLYLCHSGKV